MGLAEYAGDGSGDEQEAESERRSRNHGDWLSSMVAVKPDIAAPVPNLAFHAGRCDGSKAVVVYLLKEANGKVWYGVSIDPPVCSTIGGEAGSRSIAFAQVI